MKINTDFGIPGNLDELKQLGAPVIVPPVINGLFYKRREGNHYYYNTPNNSIDTDILPKKGTMYKGYEIIDVGIEFFIDDYPEIIITIKE